MAKLKHINVFLRGGLGNQLFQYSTGLAISKRFNRQLVLRTDLLPMSEDTIGGISRWPNQISGFRHSGTIRSVGNQPAGRTNVTGKVMQLIRMAGDLSPKTLNYLGWISGDNVSSKSPIEMSSIRFINSYTPMKELAYENRKYLADELSSMIDPTSEYTALSNEMIKQPTTVVHIRMGDYLNLANIYGELTTEYLSRALQFVSLTSADERVWVFTDSPTHLSDSFLSILNPERIIGPTDLEKPLENMVLMSKGSNIIAANSSFSWWVCFLAEDSSGVVVPHMTNAKVNNFANEHEPLRNWTFINVN